MKHQNTGLFEMIVGVLTTCHTQYTWYSSIFFFYLIEQHSKFLLHTLHLLYMCTLCDSTGLFEMIVGVLTTCHTQYTWYSSIFFFYLIEQHSKFLLHTLQVCTLCDSININTIIDNHRWHATSIFISVINQLDTNFLFYNKFISRLYMFRALCAHHQGVKIALHSLWYHHTYRWPSRSQVERGLF